MVREQMAGKEHEHAADDVASGSVKWPLALPFFFLLVSIEK